jgi:AraC-like DNA-binding protein
MLHQVNIFLLLFGALQGWLLSLWFFKNRAKHISNFFIGLLLFIVGLQLTGKVISKMWLMENASIFYELTYKLPYLVGPVLFLYCRTYKNKKLRISDVLHAIPFLIFAAWPWVGWNVFRVTLYPHAFTSMAFQLVSLSIYAYLSLRIAAKEFRQFIFIVAAAEGIIFITIALMFQYYGRFPDVRLLFLVLTALIYWITWKVISRSEQFLHPEMTVSLNTRRTPKYAHSSLTGEETQRIEQLLQKLMCEEKIYLDSTLTVDTLSNKLSTTRHNLSQVLNERLRKTYADYINSFRLEESRQRLTNPANLRFTIAGIAMDSGFSSVSSFNDLFKKRYGITPSAFREQHLNKMSA